MSVCVRDFIKSASRFLVESYCAIEWKGVDGSKELTSWHGGQGFRNLRECSLLRSRVRNSLECYQVLWSQFVGDSCTGFKFGGSVFQGLVELCVSLLGHVSHKKSSGNDRHEKEELIVSSYCGPVV